MQNLLICKLTDMNDWEQALLNHDQHLVCSIVFSHRDQWNINFMVLYVDPPTPLSEKK